jgi:hypothetical protein
MLFATQKAGVIAKRPPFCGNIIATPRTKIIIIHMLFLSLKFTTLVNG